MSAEFDPDLGRDPVGEVRDQNDQRAEVSPVAEWFAFGPYVLAPGERILKRDGQALQIGDKALDLLIALTERPGEILSKTDLAELVWRRPHIEDGSLRVAVASLRKLLGQTPDGGDYLINVVGRGYRFSPSVPFERWPDRVSAVAQEPRRIRNSAQGRLPPLLNPVFGRRSEIQRVAELLKKSRLITIVGPGGIGKTTTAISCAAVQPKEAAICFVDLSPIRDPALVLPRVATALGIDHGTDAADLVAGHLASESMLIVLDNAEHVADAVASFVEELLAGAPNVRILVTSREPLGAPGESILRLKPLDLPSASTGLSAAEAMKFDAIALFVDRVQASAPDFKLTDVLAPAAAEICQKLDGVALAIRLAAARVPAFGVKGTATLLEDKFKLLSQKQRNGPARHQTLEAVFDWSYDLLLPAEQALLTKIAIFSHSFTLDAVKQIAIGPDDAPGIVLAAIGDLVAKSLVVFAEDEAGARYHLLETVRVFALERLTSIDPRGDVARCHAYYVIGECKAYQDALAKARDREAATIARATLDDARAALQWAVRVADWGLVSDLVHVAGGLLTQLGFAREVGIWITGLLEVEVDPEKRLDLMISLGGALWLSTPEDVTTIKVYSEAYALARSLRNEPAQLRAAWSLVLSTCSARRPAIAIQASRLLADGHEQNGSTDVQSATVLTRVLGGVSQHLIGDYAASEQSIRWLIKHYPVEQRAAEASAYLYDPRRIGKPFLAWIEYFSGRLSDAAITVEQMIADDGDHVPSVVNNILRSAFPIAVDSGRWEDAWGHIAMLERHGADRTTWRGWTSALRDIAAVRLERSSAALRRLEDFVTDGETFGGFKRQTWYYMCLAKGYLMLGYYDRAETLLRELLAYVETEEGNWWRPEMITLDAHLLAPLNPRRAYTRYLEAIEIAKAEGSNLLELRAALGAMRVAEDDNDSDVVRGLSREAFRRLVLSSPTAGSRVNFQLLRYSLCVCRRVQRTSRLITPHNELEFA